MVAVNILAFQLPRSYTLGSLDVGKIFKVKKVAWINLGAFDIKFLGNFSF